MASTKEQILGVPKVNTQGTVPEVTVLPTQTPVTNGGTASTGNDGNEAQVNDGSAVFVAPAAKKTPEAAQPAKAPERKRMSYVEMFQQMSPYKPPTKEELERERKKEKREKVFAAIGDGIAALSNLYFTTKGAPNAFDPKNSLVGKARERWEKLKKEREENARYYTQAYMQAMRNDEEADRDDRNWQHQLEREKIGDDRYNADIEHRDARERVEDERWQKNFDEAKRQFNITSAQNATRINMERTRLKKELEKDVVTFAIGRGKGTIAVPTNALNASNVSYVFSKLPADVQAQCQGEAVYGKDGKQVTKKTGKKIKDANGVEIEERVPVYKKPTTEDMLVCIGANIDGSVDAQDALREIAGNMPKGGKQLGLDGGGGKQLGLK